MHHLQSLIETKLFKKKQFQIKQLHQVHLVEDVKVYKEQSFKQVQQENVPYYKQDYYNKVLVKHTKLDNKTYKIDLT